jgi:CheY-like chemotaxis protein
MSTATDTQTATHALTILVVENHPDTLESLKLYLEDSGHKVDTALTVAQAVQRLGAADYDVLLCDIGLPDGSGWDLTSRLRDKKSVFAVAMSGFGQNADNARSRAAGYRHHLLKPFRAVELDKVLAEAAALAQQPSRARPGGPAPPPGEPRQS